MVESVRYFQGFAPEDPKKWWNSASCGLLASAGCSRAIRPGIPLKRADAHGLVLRPLNEVEVAEVWEVGQVGEDRARGKREAGTFNNDKSSEREKSADEHVTQTLFHFQPTRCSHTGNVRIMRCGACTRKSVCLRASGWVWCLHPPSHSRLLLFGWVRNSDSATLYKNIVETRLDCGQILWLLTTLGLSFLSRMAPVVWFLLRLLKNANSRLFHSPLLWPSVVLPTVLMPSLPVRRPWRRTPPEYWWPAGWGGWLMMFFCEIIFPIYAQLLLPSTLVSVMEAVLVCCRQHCVGKVYAYFFLVIVAAHCGRYWIIEPNIRPIIMDKHRFIVSRIVLPFVPGWRKSSLGFCVASKCVKSFVVMELPWIWSTFGTSWRDLEMHETGASLNRLTASRSSFNNLPQLQREVPSNT